VIVSIRIKNEIKLNDNIIVSTGVRMINIENQFNPAQNNTGMIRARNTSDVPKSGCLAIKINGIRIMPTEIKKYLILLISAY